MTYNMSDTYERIYRIVRQIPAGRFTTYGRVAALAGNPRWSRVVGYALQACKDDTIPCHRVLYQDGSASPVWEEGGCNIQRLLLEQEGVRFTGGKADMGYLWP